METLVPALGPASQFAPIAGYVLRQRLGSGGYGEVWEAEAPGGLRKAIKFVYGRLDETRAQRELKSLERIKEVHHPFLLSLERIEVIDGRLIIVTELAQGCLKARFEEHRKAGLPGVPREELLGYLRDAADALDFIHDQHRLQHLDIKPENLLIVGNHAKVADFGLLKDLDESVSIMGGVTPLYCPPEALDGRPNRHSDQYSLAIVFQEMLTGSPPFTGRTAAQLAAQHLHSSPVLSVLPPADQPVIARALSKIPEKRFPSCRALVDALTDPLATPSRLARRTQRPADSPRVARTEPLDLPRAPSELAGAGTDPCAALPNATLCDLARIDIEAGAAYRPTIVLGVGGTAAHVLAGLQRRLTARFHDPAEVPALQLILFDTDVRELTTSAFRRGDGSIPTRQCVAIPLRGAKDYRLESGQLLEWLSRRWIYNIPRSLKTEGMRPLGRLAFVTHAAAILARVRAAIEAAVDGESIERSRETTGLDFRPGSPRVFVVGSIAGGTASGVVLDMGYAVRHILCEMQLPDEGVTGVLLHSARREPVARDLAIANTISCLKELADYSAAGGCYPGDPACDLPPFYGNNATFHHTYFVPLGSELREAEHATAADLVSEYLYQSSATAAASFFDKVRQDDGADPQDNPLCAGRVRTLGLSLFDTDAANAAAVALEQNAADEQGDDAEDCEEKGCYEDAGDESLEQFEEETDEDVADADGLSDDEDPSDEESLELDRGCETEPDVDDTQRIGPAPPTIEDLCRRAVPALAACGGMRRTLLSAPATIDRERLIAANHGIDAASMTFVEDPRDAVFICQEVEAVPMESILAQLVGSRRDYLELADRLHTRIDVEWTPRG